MQYLHNALWLKHGVFYSHFTPLSCRLGCRAIRPCSLCLVPSVSTTSKTFFPQPGETLRTIPLITKDVALSHYPTLSLSISFSCTFNAFFLYFLYLVKSCSSQFLDFSLFCLGGRSGRLYFLKFKYIYFLVAALIGILRQANEMHVGVNFYNESLYYKENVSEMYEFFIDKTILKFVVQTEKGLKTERLYCLKFKYFFFLSFFIISAFLVPQLVCSVDHFSSQSFVKLLVSLLMSCPFINEKSLCNTYCHWTQTLVSPFQHRVWL